MQATVLVMLNWPQIRHSIIYRYLLNTIRGIIQENPEYRIEHDGDQPDAIRKDIALFNIMNLSANGFDEFREEFDYCAANIRDRQWK